MSGPAKAGKRPKRQKAAPGPEPSPLLTYEEVAQMLRVDPRTVRTWADAGRLKRVRLSPQSPRVTRESVNALIEAGTE